MHKYHFLRHSKRLIFLLTSIIFICSCSKPSTTDNSSSGSGSGGGSGSGSGGNVGSLIINVNWSTPSPTGPCPIQSFVDIEVNGSTSNYSDTYTISPVRYDKRLAIGNYTYTIRKRPNTGCSSFTPLVKTGTFTITACPTLCGNATVLNITMD